MADPLNYQGPQSQETFSLGVNKNSGGNFRTLDISRINEGRHKSLRLDTFQTPMGRLPDIEESSPNHRGCGFQPMLLQALEADLFEEFHSSMEGLATDIIGSFSGQLQDMAESLILLRADMASGHISASSHEAHTGYKTGGDAPDMSEVVQEVRAGNLAVLESLQQLRLEGVQVEATGNIEATSCGPVLEAIAEMNQRQEGSRESIRQMMERLESGSGVEGAGTRKEAGSATDCTQVLERLELSVKVLEDIRQCALEREAQEQPLSTGVAASVPDNRAEADISRVLHAFAEHAVESRTAFSDISKTVMHEVRKSWVEVASLWGGGSQSTQAKVDMSEILEATEKLRRDIKLELSTLKSQVAAGKDGTPRKASKTGTTSTVGAETPPTFGSPDHSLTMGTSSTGTETAPKLRNLLQSMMQDGFSSLQQVVLTHIDEGNEQVQKKVLKRVDETNEQLQKRVNVVHENILSKVGSDSKLAMIELNKLTAVMDGIMDMSSSQLDLSPILQAITRLDTQPSEINLNSVVRSIADLSSSVGAVQAQLGQGGKLPTEDDFLDLRQVFLASLRDLEVSSEQLQEKVDNLEERVISRMNSNHKISMHELQKTTSTSNARYSRRSTSDLESAGTDQTEKA